MSPFDLRPDAQFAYRRQNKVDLIREQQADEHQQSILNFVKGTVADNAPIVPISAQLRYNIDALVEYIVTKIPVPVRDFTTSPKLIVIRSFDVNKPGAEVQDLKGGVAGGSLLKGVLKLGQEIEVRPGVVSKDAEGRINCKPIRSKIVTLLAEKNELRFAVPGGLIGVGTRKRFSLSMLLALLVADLAALHSHRSPAYTWRSSRWSSAWIKGLTAFNLHRDRDQLLPAPTTSRCQDRR